MPTGNHPTLEAALNAARAVPGKPEAPPVYVYPRSFARMMADALAPALASRLEGGGE